MPDNNNIKWRKIDEEKLNKQIERFNQKVRRVKKNKPEIAEQQPDLILKDNKKEMIEKFKQNDRKFFNNYLRSLSRYSKKGNENVVESKNGLKVSKWDKKETEIKTRVIKRKNNAELKRLENTEARSQGQGLGINRIQMDSERLISLKSPSFNFDKFKDTTEWDKFKRGIDAKLNTSVKDELYKRNYLKGLENFGEEGKELREIIEKIPAKDVVRMYYEEQEASIDFHYDPIDRDAKLQILLEIWRPLLGVDDEENSDG